MVPPAVPERHRHFASWPPVAVLVITLGAAITVIVIAVMLEADAPYEHATPAGEAILALFPSLAYTLIGSWIVFKRPRNLVGWALLLPSGDVIGGVLGFAYAEFAVFARPEDDLPGGVAAAAIAQGAWTSVLAGAFLLLLLFPNGRMPTRGWRPVAWATLLGFAVIWVLIATSPTLDAPYDGMENPLAFTSGEAQRTITYVLVGPCLIALVAAAASLIVRFRRSSGDEREQFKWIGLTAVVLIATLPAGIVDGWDGLATAPFLLALLALPVSVGVAVLKYRLYDIDTIINRTLVYVPLTAILAGLFVASTTMIRTVFTDLTGAGSDAAIALSTLAVVALLTPVKNRLQALVDRHFKERPDPFRGVTDLVKQGQAVVEVTDTRAYVARLLEEMAHAVGAAGIRVEHNDGSRYAVGDDRREPSLRQRLSHEGEDTGAALVWVMPPGQRLSESDLPPAIAEATALLAHVLSLAARDRSPQTPGNLSDRLLASASEQLATPTGYT